MPTRIYAFAKELGLDNKALLDICEKASIKGKGSALASLDDTEISQIKAFMAGSSATTEAPAEPETGAPVRPRSTPKNKKKIGEIASPVREVVDEVEAETPVVEETADVEVAAVETVEETPTVEEATPVVETAEDTASPVVDATPARSGLHSRLKGGDDDAPAAKAPVKPCLLYTSPSPRDRG